MLCCRNFQRAGGGIIIFDPGILVTRGFTGDTYRTSRLQSDKSEAAQTPADGILVEGRSPGWGCGQRQVGGQGWKHGLG